MRLNLNEMTLPTIQGEGVWVGRPSLFIRVQGCSIRCAHCDTKKSWDPAGKGHGMSVTVTEICKMIQPYPHVDVVITGGEPLDPIHVDGVTALCKKLTALKRRITIETSGMVPTPEEIDDLNRYVDLWSVSPKLQGMHVTSQATFNDELLGQMTYGRGDLQLKFVLDPRRMEMEIAEMGDLIGDEVLCCVDHLILQPMTRPNDGKTAILAAWTKLAKVVLMTDWLLQLRPQIIPQCHKLVGMV